MLQRGLATLWQLGTEILNCSECYRGAWLRCDNWEQRYLIVVNVTEGLGYVVTTGNRDTSELEEFLIFEFEVCSIGRRFCSSLWRSSRISERKCTDVVSGNCLLVTVPDTSRRLNPAPIYKHLFLPGTTKNQNQCRRRIYRLNRAHRHRRRCFKRAVLDCHFNCCFNP